MARDTITVTKLVEDASSSVEYGSVTKQAVTQANGIAIEKALENKNNSLQITIENTSSSDATITVKAGNEFPNKILGDLTFIAPKGQITPFMLVDISRFENRDGSIELDFSTGFTGNIWAVAKKAGLRPVEQ